eukprot:s1523_g9.t3
MESAPLWTVVGGQKSGGLQVRRGAALTSALETQRLEFGATVWEMARSKGRLRYELVEGLGPASGWVTLQLRGVDLLRPVESEVLPSSPAPAVEDLACSGCSWPPGVTWPKVAAESGAVSSSVGTGAGKDTWEQMYDLNSPKLQKWQNTPGHKGVPLPCSVLPSTAEFKDIPPGPQVAVEISQGTWDDDDDDDDDDDEEEEEEEEEKEDDQDHLRRQCHLNSPPLRSHLSNCGCCSHFPHFFNVM